MRQRLIDELTFLARKDSRIVLLTADLGFGDLHPNFQIDTLMLA